AGDPQTPRQGFLTKGGAVANASDGAELGQAVHVFHMVTRYDRKLALHSTMLCRLDYSRGLVAVSCEEGPRCENSRPHGQTLDWRADEMTVACLGPASPALSELPRARDDVTRSLARGACRETPSAAAPAEGRV